MSDNLDLRLQTEGREFFSQLFALPDAYDGPDGLREEPYGLMAYGEASSLSHVFKDWVDAPIVLSGTQFLFAGGFDYGDAAPLKISAELAGAQVVMLGHGVHEPNLTVTPDPFSFYSYASYLAYATGHKDDLAEANTIMRSLREQMRPEVETERNPAKTLAWQLWNRVPILLTNKRQAGLSDLVQRVFARVGKTLAIPTGEHPLEMLSGALEGRHQLGDDMVGLILGHEDEEVALGIELLETRVAQIERLSLPFADLGSAPKDSGAYSLIVWYMSVWVAGYLALLHGLEPEDSQVYEALRGALPTNQDISAVN